MNILNLILQLCKINSVSGREKNIASFLQKELGNYSKKVELTSLNSVLAKINNFKQKSLNILLEAHIDSIGLIVESITEDGFLKISNCGGIDPKVLISQEVVVLGRTEITGFIFSNLNKNENNLTVKNLLIDVNLSEKKAKEIIKIGDCVVFKYNPIKLQNNRLSVRYLDNRSSVAAIFLILEKLKQKKINCNLNILFSSLEETTQGGIKTAYFEKKPDVAICIDVSFAKTLHLKKAGVGNMGDGPLIGVAPILDRNYSSKLIEIAKKNNIPHQIEPMNNKTGTNADEIAVLKSGIKTCLCSIPIKNMHTPTEIIELNDIENTADLIYNFIVSIEKDGVI